MATATIFAYTPDVLSWTSGASDKNKTTTSTTTVTNSSGMTVYWTQGSTNSGSIPDTGTLLCQQGTSNKKWNFSESSGGTVRITLTVSGSGGGGAPPPGGRGQGQGQTQEE